MNEPQLTNFIDIARQQLLKEIIDGRVGALDNWLQQCDVVWKEQHVLLPYPKYPTYPSDDEVLTRAKLLNEIHQQTHNKKETNEKVITEPMVEQTVEQPKEETEIIKINSEDSESNTQNSKEIKLEPVENKLPPGFNYKRKK